MIKKYAGTGVEIGVSDMGNGNMSVNWGDEDEVFRNREKFLQGLGLSSKNVVMASLLGTDGIVEVGEREKGKTVEGDALITRNKNLGLWILVGDCFPVVIYEKTKNMLSLVHLGFKGTDLRLAEKVVTKMKNIGGNPAKMMVWIGPGIRKDSYIWEPDVVTQKHNRLWESFLENINGKVHVDVLGYIIRQLTESGIRPENIEDCGINTGSDDRYFSHYRSKRTGEDEGRFGVVVIMNK